MYILKCINEIEVNIIFNTFIFLSKLIVLCDSTYYISNYLANKKKERERES